ncbi:2-Methylisocitrate lyase, PEP mutase family [Lentzea fradiae]|uniref:2-Methylisocitrate lyase, PEP mutase family n=1 Tax=Lentzea fradiae TaxID=200378 RepID=A0A1G7R3A5_9PSEU|nr:FAD-dependent oxidoreductase [Lentzea fradiae]SDG05194.1 2-Methylisocitrate lyase, PEP mutase family [Lentzea fradiae]
MADVDPTVDSPDVIVVGAGPVGLVAALKLARAGRRVTVLEAGAELSGESRASTFHPSTLELLEELDVAAELVRTGLVAPLYQYRRLGAGVIAEFDLAALAGETAFPYRLQNEQNNLTRIIAERLREFPHARIVYGSPVVKVEDAGDRALVFVEGDGRAASWTSPWVIAADGASSVVRKSLGIAFDGITLPERFLVISTRYALEDEIPGLAWVSYLSDPVDWGVLLRTPRHWRVLVPVGDEESDEAAVAPARVQERLKRLVPKDSDYEIDHASLYQVHQRVASTFERGRVLIAGDAAHVNNPLGGLGMNSGIHDAVAAVDAVLAALDGADARRCAEAYSLVRREEAMQVVQRAAQANYDRMQERDPVKQKAQDDRLAATADDPEATRNSLRRSSLMTSLATSTRELRRLTDAARRSPASPGRRLSELLTRGPVVAPGCHDALSALLARQAGHQAVFLSGAALSIATLGLPDRGFLGLTDLAAQVARITSAAAVPVVVDADTGFGGAEQAAETVIALERAGAAAIQLEDQVSPKRCGHLPGKEIETTEAMVAKLAAARRVRRDALLIARTDALGVLGLPAAIDRAKAYAEAGADLVFVLGVKDAETLREVHRNLPGVALVLGRSEADEHDVVLPPRATLADCGVELVIQPVSALLAAAAGLRDAYAATDADRGPVSVERTPWTELTALVEE